MLPENIPEHVEPEPARVLQERVPNYCPECGAEIVLAGGADPRTSGIYPHIDPVTMCAECGRKYRHGAAFEQAEGQRDYDLGLASEQAAAIFGKYVAWCNLHTERMKPTKSYYVDRVPARQYKCRTCDLVATVLYTGPEPDPGGSEPSK